MLKTIQDVTVGIFIACVVILTLVAVLSIWGIFNDDVLWKSLSTIGVIGFASLVILVAAKAVEHKNTTSTLS
jgi:hypothetical protein